MRQAAAIIEDGIARGEFRRVDPEETARALLDATTRFHNPAHAEEWSDPRIDADYDAVWRLVTVGLAA